MRDGSCELRKKVCGGGIEAEGDSGREYRVLDEGCNFILGWTVSKQSINTNMFVYDWKNNNYSNVLTFTRNFYNFKILTEMSMASQEVSHDRFVLFATGEKYDTIHFAQV